MIRRPNGIKAEHVYKLNGHARLLFKAVVIKHFIYSNSFFRDLNWADQTTAEHAT